MKKPLLLMISFCFLISVNFCTTMNIRFDYDPEMDFNLIKTYNWMEKPDDQGLTPMNDIILKRIQKAVNENLASKGYQMVSGSPDFLIAPYVTVKEKSQVNYNWGYDYSFRSGYPGSNSNASVYYYQEGTLVLDFISPEKKEQFYRGSAETELKRTTTPEKSEALIKKAVDKIMKHFPPETPK